MAMDTSAEYLKGFGLAIVDMMESADRHNICPHMAIKIAEQCEKWNCIHEFTEYFKGHYGTVERTAEPRTETARTRTM